MKLAKNSLNGLHVHYAVHQNCTQFQIIIPDFYNKTPILHSQKSIKYLEIGV